MVFWVLIGVSDLGFWFLNLEIRIGIGIKDYEFMCGLEFLFLI